MMDDQTYQKIVDLIRHNQSIVEFADFGEGTSLEWITKAEEKIGKPLPESYKWWLLNYGGGEIGREEIFSIYEQDFDSVVGGDIVHMYQLALKNGQDPRRLPLCHSDMDGVFTFEIVDDIRGNEYHIVSEATGTKYSDNFLDFIEKRIALFA